MRLNRFKRFTKSNLGKKGAMKKLSSLLRSHDAFGNENEDENENFVVTKTKNEDE